MSTSTRPMSNGPVIGVTTGSRAAAGPYAETIRRLGGTPRLILPGHRRPAGEILPEIGGLLLTGGADLGPLWYGRRDGLDPPSARRDAVELPLLQAALDNNIPVLGISRGMQALNLALGGSLIDGLDEHAAHREDRKVVSSYHRIYITPGSKLAAIIGSGGFVRVNSRHRKGVREAQKSRLLMASAYSLDDGVIEALESPDHDWVIGVQFHPERRMEVAPQFDRLFQGLIERARR